VHIQHKGSDDSVWRGNASTRSELIRAVRYPINSLNRPKDVSFAVGCMERLNREDTHLRGGLDLSRLGIAGHSFGAYTALAIACEIFVGPRGGEISVADPRFKAAVVMSASVPPRKKAYAQRVFSRIKIPCLHITGTRDHSIIGNTRAEDRRIPFDIITGADQYLTVFIDADHMVFSGTRLLGFNKRDAVFHRLVQESSTASWDAYLKGRATAKDWIAKEGLEATLEKYAKFEKKLLP
jgi:predicted dienelactone hydrolase